MLIKQFLIIVFALSLKEEKNDCEAMEGAEIFILYRTINSEVKDIRTFLR